MTGAGRHRELLRIAERAVRAGGEAAMAYFGKAVRTRMKGSEPVSEADLAAEGHILRLLEEHAPAIPIISEESKDDPEARRVAEAFWAVDPIDGTIGFLDGQRDWAVQIGLVEAGRPVLGVVFSPPTDTLWRGIVGAGAERIQGEDGEPDPISVSSCSDCTIARLARSSAHPSRMVNHLATALGIEQFIDCGGAGTKATMVAEGTVDLYVITGPRTMIWDLAGPEAIVVAAGGRVSDFRGRELDYTGTELANLAGVVVSNGKLHDIVVDCGAELLADRLALLD